MKKNKIVKQMRNVNYLCGLALKSNKIMLLLYVVQIPINVILPYLLLWIPKLILEGITKHFILVDVIVVLGPILVAFLCFSSGKCFLEGKVNWYKRSFVNTMLVTVDEKTMLTDYINVEGVKGQELRQKALSAVYSVGQNVFDKYSSFMISCCALILYVTTISNIHYLLAILIILTSLLEYFLTIKSRNIRLSKKDELAKNDKKLNYIESNTTSVQAAREIRLYQMNQLMENIHTKCLEDRIRVEKAINKKEKMYGLCKNISAVLRIFLSYSYLTYLVIQKTIGIDEFVLFVGIVSGITQWVADTLNHASEVKQMHMYLEDYFSYIHLDEKPKECVQTMMNEIPQIEFDHVCFRYEGASEDTIHDISFAIQKGEKIALVGNNGAGKTTLVKLLSGLYEPTSGRISVNGLDLSALRQEEYRNTLATVFQDIMLLPVTIAQNISSCIESEMDVGLVEQCIDRIGMKQRIGMLTKGIHTYQIAQVREEAVDFSGGEQQKLWLAKAIYKRGKLLILDEPTAALDPIAENDIYEHYNQILNHATSIFISHRLASTSFCNRILYLSQGRLKEMGTHKELMELKGDYYRMYHEQSKYYQENYKEEMEA